MANTGEKLIGLPIDDAILVLKEEMKQRTDGYTAYLSYGGKGDPAEEVCLDALAMAISALEQTRWIPVKDRLPKSIANKVIVRCENDYIGFGHYEDYKGKQTWYNLESDKPFTDWNYDDDCDSYEVTHWMPLPQPPKGE